MGLREFVPAFVEVHLRLQSAPVRQRVHEQRLRRDGQHYRPAVVALVFGEGARPEARVAQDAFHDPGRGMCGVFALSAEPREQTPDAGAFEIVVVAAVVGGDEELHARISPNFPVILRDAGHRPLFPDVEAQHQIGARVEHAERNLRCIGILLRPVAASYRLRFDAAESGLDGPFVGRDDACYFPYLHDCFPLPLLLHRLFRFMRFYALRYFAAIPSTMRHISP